MNEVPDQLINPPEPRCSDYNDYLEHECDRLNDEEKLRILEAGLRVGDTGTRDTKRG